MKRLLGTAVVTAGLLTIPSSAQVANDHAASHSDSMTGQSGTHHQQSLGATGTGSTAGQTGLQGGGATAAGQPSYSGQTGMQTGAGLSGDPSMSHDTGMMGRHTEVAERRGFDLGWLGLLGLAGLVGLRRRPQTGRSVGTERHVNEPVDRV